ncbi:type IV toxin-antitoxin system AbiEi family antitoxin [Microbacterium paludicola]|uniref:type IV toxin-antitoxin system AbiEi family antitoxin n=1 Tax=Microbacterium paludicola TaxID=300019 RepID=UPI00090314C3|nr:type IV toxin-antitoxin system AbiEi family antitoxin [Microbacterium paludicola]
MNDSLTSELAARFDEYDLRLEEPLDLAHLGDRETWRVTLLHPQGRETFHLIYSPDPTMASLRWAKDLIVSREPVLVVGPRVTERSAEQFRMLGLRYLDAAGNANIHFGGVYIDVRGRRARTGAGQGMRPRLTRGGVNLFSLKRAQVIFAILTWDSLLTAPVRSVATSSKVSVGLAQETLELLASYGYLDDERQIVKKRRGELIDLWAGTYATGLGSPAKTSSFSGAIGRIEPAGYEMVVSGESAVPSLLRPESLVLYSDEFPVRAIAANRWHRDEETPNIYLRHKFWSDPEPAPPGVRVAPPLLVYADLMAANESRQREAAAMLREADDRLR